MPQLCSIKLNHNVEENRAKRNSLSSMNRTSLRRKKSHSKSDP